MDVVVILSTVHCQSERNTTFDLDIGVVLNGDFNTLTIMRLMTDNCEIHPTAANFSHYTTLRIVKYIYNIDMSDIILKIYVYAVFSCRAVCGSSP